MYELGMYDKLSKSFVLSKEESHRIEMTKKAVKFCDTLERKGIQYDYCIRHKEATGCVDYSRWNDYLGDDYAVGKHLLVQERKGEKKKYLVITDSSKQVDLKALKEELDCRKLEFVSPSDMESLINATPGNVSIFNLIYDENKEIELIIDEDLLEADEIAFHPLYNGMSIFMPLRECFYFLATIGRSAEVMTIPEKEKSLVYKK